MNKDPVHLRKVVDQLLTERKSLNKQWEDNKLCIAKLEAVGTSGGLAEKYAKLEGRHGRLQKRCQGQERKLKEQTMQLEQQSVEVQALRKALELKMEDWQTKDGEGADTKALVYELTVCKEELGRKQHQINDQSVVLNKLANDMSELTFANKVLQAAEEQHKAEGAQMQEHIRMLTEEMQNMEDTKMQMLEHMEQVLSEGNSLQEEVNSLQRQLEEETRQREG
eukprot:CAMPEP_0174376430 /NCGR_PEP_ID=MMETSP0811_2-20130205/118152_1 /TAXON_ID=73025 ORGANISM="Eutreptiella gymnastica-like, Strain CCMP1594" /NCGR_SAMPLE_ID=MMETSP0811_2 /ASSEMBLY_ACC=CAM_ASM_000667 /LENGTH=222 /DNA_ID=CAMNT_0015527605 /DNA_START=146 /DNA_END=810 /DNA_ORIENTATION=+